MLSKTSAEGKDNPRHKTRDLKIIFQVFQTPLAGHGKGTSILSSLQFPLAGTMCHARKRWGPPAKSRGLNNTGTGPGSVRGRPRSPKGQPRTPGDGTGTTRRRTGSPKRWPQSGRKTRRQRRTNLRSSRNKSGRSKGTPTILHGLTDRILD